MNNSNRNGTIAVPKKVNTGCMHARSKSITYLSIDFLSG